MKPAPKQSHKNLTSKGMISKFALWCIEALSGSDPQAVQLRDSREFVPIQAACEHPKAQRQKFKIAIGGQQVALQFGRAVNEKDLRLVRTLVNSGKKALSTTQLQVACELREKIEAAVAADPGLRACLYSLAL